MAANRFATNTRTVSSLDHARIRREPIQWPNGARVAVTWTIIFELFPGSMAIYTPEVAKQALFGGRRGVRRLLEAQWRTKQKSSR